VQLALQQADAPAGMTSMIDDFEFDSDSDDGVGADGRDRKVNQPLQRPRWHSPSPFQDLRLVRACNNLVLCRSMTSRA